MTLAQRTGGWRRSAVIATIAFALVAGWEWLTVHFNDRDNWTALYYTGDQSSLPPQLAVEDVFRFSGSTGYDGQYYHYIAHDPFFQRGFDKYVDNPRLRYRRILVPATAYLLAFGNDDYLDSVYVAVMLVLTGLGTFWLARFAERHALSPWWGLAFPFVPAVLVTLDRMTVDLALAALAVGFILYAQQERWAPLYGVLIAAALVRETGLILIAAACIWRPRRAWQFLLCALPFAAWELFVRTHTGPDQTVFATVIPLRGLVERTLQPVQFALTSRWLAIAATLDYLALLGVWAALASAACLAWKRKFDILTIAIVLFAGFTAVLGQSQIWSDAYAFGRTLTPLFLWLLMFAMCSRQWVFIAPIAMIVPRIVFQFQPQWKGILHQVGSGV